MMPNPPVATWRRVVFGIFLMFLLVLALIVFLPADEAQPVLGLVGVLARWVAPMGVPVKLAEEVIQFGANIVLFMPLGVLLGVLFTRLRLWQIAGLGMLISAFIETVQGWIPGRVQDPWDVVANTAGTALGGLLVLALRWYTHRKQTPGDHAPTLAQEQSTAP